MNLNCFTCNFLDEEKSEIFCLGANVKVGGDVKNGLEQKICIVCLFSQMHPISLLYRVLQAIAPAASPREKGDCCVPAADTMWVLPWQAEAEEDCHSDTDRAGNADENESPAETDLQACFFNYIFISHSISSHPFAVIGCNYGIIM